MPGNHNDFYNLPAESDSLALGCPCCDIPQLVAPGVFVQFKRGSGAADAPDLCGFVHSGIFYLERKSCLGLGVPSLIETYTLPEDYVCEGPESSEGASCDTGGGIYSNPNMGMPASVLKGIATDEADAELALEDWGSDELTASSTLFRSHGLPAYEEWVTAAAVQKVMVRFGVEAGGNPCTVRFVWELRDQDDVVVTSSHTDVGYDGTEVTAAGPTLDPAWPISDEDIETISLTFHLLEIIV